uniref:VP1 n=5 Tax=Norovirus GI TaxID=122928 RepID=A0A5P1JSA4_NORV|nr:major capsid protein [Norovirus Hu/GI.4/1643/2008/US]QCT04930.1 VP1 [Norovirus GI]QEM24802.1 VP1 [Norovirus GI]QPJ58834.1 VP1 [Norovirus GI]
MMMASKDATPSADGATGAGQLVPEVNTADPIPIDPVAGSSTALATAGQVNLIDPWIINNFVQAPQGEFTISPNNTPGDVLFDLQLGPHLNPFLSHLSQMYNGWVGNMRVRVVLAGNAFTAGKVIICCVPPGFQSRTLSIAQATLFPHVIADVRTLDPVEVPLEDVRNVLYHNNDTQPTMRLLCMLYTPLRTGGASGGTDSFVVAGRVLTCPGPDFNFLFLVPPTVEQKTRPFTVPNIPLKYLSNSRIPNPIEGMSLSPDQTQNVQFQNGRCTIDGQPLGTTPVSVSQLCKFRGRITSGQRVLNLTELDGSPFMAFAAPAPAGFPDLGSCDWHIEMSKIPNSSTQNNPIVVNSVKPNSQQFVPHLSSITLDDNVSSGGDYIGTIQWTSPPSDSGGANTNFWKIPDYGSSLAEASQLAPAVYPPGFNEVIVYFMASIPGPNQSGSPNLVPCLLPQEYITHFISEQAPIQGEAALLHYVDPDTNRNLGEFKLYPGGYLTCVPNSSSTGPQQLPLDGVFVFASWVSRFYQLKPVGTAGPARGRLGVRR